MEDLDIKQITISDIENNYKNLGNQLFERDIIKHLSFEIGLFNKRNVEIDYLCIFKNNINIGCGILVYKDKRKKQEFAYEKQLINLPNSCLLKNCYIEKPFRNKGYFSLMFSNLKQKAKSHGFEKMVLAVNKNNINAFQIFKHLGFKPLKSIFVNDENFIVMEKELFDV